MTNIVPRPQSAPVAAVDIVSDLKRFEDTILDQLDQVGLPTEDVLVDLEERDTLLTSLGTALRRLPTTDRGRSLYVSKMISPGR